LSSCIDVIAYKLILRAAFGAALVLAAAGCALFGPSKPDPSAQMPALESRIFALVESERERLDPKAHALKLDPELTDIAHQRSVAMAAANSFTSTDPHASATLLMRQDANFQGLIGENVAAQHFLPDDPIDVETFAKRFVDGWIASKPHKDNLSFVDYDRSGVGAAANGDTIYVTQLFTTDLGLGAKDGQDQGVKAVQTPQQGKDETQVVPLRGAIVPGKSPH
jgi:uncharacterized protein YkwD